MNTSANTATGAILITGASSGMGKACALRLAREGYTVFAGVRKEQDAQALRQEGASRLIPVILDVAKGDTIAAAVQTIRETVGAAGLVGLVNNAGIGVTAPIELVPLEQLRRQLEINVIGQVAVIQACLPLLRQAHGRIINVGSVGGRVTIPFGGPLCASKYALEAINDALRMELRPWGIHVVLVEPGAMRTPAADKLGADSEAMLATFPPEGCAHYAAAYRTFVRTFLAQHQKGAEPDVMAEAVYRALTARTPKPRYPVGPNARLLPVLATWLPARALDVLRTRRFHVFQPFGAVTE
jgi:NAD(P)-dependent dehydrogenase (short-subunit alcohol dehydrogenase family)